MLRNVIVALAVVIVLGSSAFARGGGYSGGVFRSGHFGGGFGGTPGDGHGGYGNHVSDLRGGFPGYGGRNVWGHRGAYYGPMIPPI
jgi:hypothetical protein